MPRDCLQAAPRITRKHVQYWIGLAFGRLIEAGLVTSEQRKQIRSILERYEATADDGTKEQKMEAESLPPEDLRCQRTCIARPCGLSTLIVARVRSRGGRRRAGSV